MNEADYLIESMEHAEKMGFFALPMFCAITTQTMPDGSEWPVPVGPLRYTRLAALRDAQKAPAPTGLVFMARVADPNDAKSMADYLGHLEARERELRDGSE